MNKLPKMIGVMKEYYIYIFFVGVIIRAVNLYSLLPVAIDSILFKLIGISGVILLGVDAIFNFKDKRFPYSITLFVYVILLTLTSVLNYSYGIGDNLKTIMWTAIQYFLVYQFATENKNNEKFFNRIGLGFIYSWFGLTIFSLILFFSKFGYERYYDPRHRIRIGFLESRLFGVYSDVNNGAIAALVVVILAIYFLYTKHIIGLPKFILIFSIPLQYVFIVLSGSRSTYLVGIFIVLIGIFICILKNKWCAKKNVITKVGISFFVSLVSVLAYILLFNFTKQIFQDLLPHLKELNIFDKSLGKNSPFANTLPDPNSANDTLVRKDVAESQDVSNARLSIWKSAFDLFRTNWLIGISPKNVVPYARVVIPNGYIAKVGIAIHNAYLNVLVSTGILGFLPFIFFLIKSFVTNVKKLFLDRIGEIDYRLAYCLILLSYGMYAFFNNELVYENTVGTFIFWLFLGRLNGK